jgi:hypothetical protein
MKKKDGLLGPREETMTKGEWRYDRRLRTFVHAAGYYEIERDDAGASCAELCDWIFQVANMSSISDESLGQLVRLMDEVLDPQATMCSDGIDRVVERRRGSGR